MVAGLPVAAGLLLLLPLYLHACSLTHCCCRCL